MIMPIGVERTDLATDAAGVGRMINLWPLLLRSSLLISVHSVY